MKKFFILGCPRSGTTMVQQALNRHSAVAIPPETKFFFSFIGHSRDCQFRHLERLRADLKIALPEPSRALASVSEGRAFYEEMARLYVARLDKRGAIFFGDKTPEHTGQLSRIREYFPEAKIVFLYRDGRDVALSLAKVPWMSRDLCVNFLVWLYYYRILNDARAHGYPQVYFARYEDIVRAPECQFRSMLDFLGLPFEPAVTAGFGNREGIPEREYAWKSRALEKITSSRVGVFQRELDATQIERLECLGKNALPALGYRLMVGQGRELSLTFLMRLTWGVSKLLYRMPWDSLANELLGSSWLCRAQKRFNSSAVLRKANPRLAPCSYARGAIAAQS